MPALVLVLVPALVLVPVLVPVLKLVLVLAPAVAPPPYLRCSHHASARLIQWLFQMPALLLGYPTWKGAHGMAVCSCTRPPAALREWPSLLTRESHVLTGCQPTQLSVLWTVVICLYVRTGCDCALDAPLPPHHRAVHCADDQGSRRWSENDGTRGLSW